MLSQHPALEGELEAEQRHVDAVYAQLESATRSAEQVAREGRARFQSDRTNFVREEDGTALFERDAFAYQAARRLAILDAEHEGLVFGRLDRTDGEVRYIGRIGVRDDEYEPLVIDWRARAAEPFYRATPADPMEVVRRRVLRCRNDKVIGIEDDLLDTDARRDDLVIVGEGALMAALSRARGHQMRDIVATIQAEQDEAIRGPYQGVTIIAGGPGTGKTVVALHRTAYLLYSNRRRFENGGVLVVGPSATFMSYIERVLPSLGEDSVTLHSVGGIATDVLPISASHLDDAAAAIVKGSLRMGRVLRRLVNIPLGAESPELTVTVKGDVLKVGSSELAAIRREVIANHQVNRGRDAAERAVLDALFVQLSDDVEMSRDTFGDHVSDLAAFQMFANAWWPALSAPQVLARLAEPDVLARAAHGILAADEQAAIVASYQTPDWTVADVALLDELVHILGPVPRGPADTDLSLFLDADADVSEVVTTYDRHQVVREPELDLDPHDTFAHILVDEAQDVTPMQWRMLRRRGPQASWTIVGDPAQSSWPDADEAAKALDDLIGSAPQRHYRLSTNYRSPAEVFDLAARVVQAEFPEADVPVAVRSTGVMPALLDSDETGLVARIDEQLALLGAEVDGTVGVIVPRGRITALRKALLRRDAFVALNNRAVVVDPLEVKGLEYDGVIVVAPDEIVAESPGGTRVLYVALTRPTQRLVTIDVSPAAPGAWRESLG